MFWLLRSMTHSRQAQIGLKGSQEFYTGCKCNYKSCLNRQEERKSWVAYQCLCSEPPAVKRENQTWSLLQSMKENIEESKDNTHFLRRPLGPQRRLLLGDILDVDLEKTNLSTAVSGKRLQNGFDCIENKIYIGSDLIDIVDNATKYALLGDHDNYSKNAVVVPHTYPVSSEEGEEELGEELGQLLENQSNTDCSDAESIVPLERNFDKQNDLQLDIPDPVLKSKSFVFSIPTGKNHVRLKNKQFTSTANVLSTKSPTRSLSAMPLPQKAKVFTKRRPNSAAVKSSLYPVKRKVLNFVTSDVLNNHPLQQIGHRTTETWNFIRSLEQKQKDKLTASTKTKANNVKKTAGKIESSHNLNDMIVKKSQNNLGEIKIAVDSAIPTKIINKKKQNDASETNDNNRTTVNDMDGKHVEIYTNPEADTILEVEQINIEETNKTEFSTQHTMMTKQPNSHYSSKINMHDTHNICDSSGNNLVKKIKNGKSLFIWQKIIGNDVESVKMINSEHENIVTSTASCQDNTEKDITPEIHNETNELYSVDAYPGKLNESLRIEESDGTTNTELNIVIKPTKRVLNASKNYKPKSPTNERICNRKAKSTKIEHQRQRPKSGKSRLATAEKTTLSQPVQKTKGRIGVNNISNSNPSLKKNTDKRKVTRKKLETFPVTMVSMMKTKENEEDKQGQEESTLSSVFNIQKSSVPALSTVRKTVKFTSDKYRPGLTHRAKSAPIKIKPILKIQSSETNHVDSATSVDNLVSKECNEIQTRLQNNNISVSLDTLKRALLKPCERADLSSGMQLPSSNSRLMYRSNAWQLTLQST